jgi:pimeloyl-CoA synthetase
MSAIFEEEIEEVKNYLASIKMNADFITSEFQLPPDARDALREIDQAVGKATKVLNKAYR